MSTNFPTSLDNLTNVQDGVDYPKAADINNLNDSVEALEAKVGIDNSAVSSSIDYIIKNKIWPVGSVFIAVVSTNPNTLLGFGTWSAFGAGKVLVGRDSGDADFDTAEETGGSKTVNLAHTHTGPSHTHTYSGTTAANTNTGFQDNTHDESGWEQHTHTYSGTTSSDGTGNTGSSGSATQSIVQPYIVVYMWKRTA